jgi:hypothetical protein
MSTQKIDLIRQALSASESSTRLARQLLAELEKEGEKSKPIPKDLPGIVGVFDGQNMMTEKGENFPVPENYASKSILVVGDTLKIIEEGGEKRFRQVEHVKRHKTDGIITKKDGKWSVVTSEGSYRVLPASISHYNGEVGDEALVQLPASNLQTTWAAVENVTKKTAKAEGGEKKEEKAEVIEKPVVKEEKEVVAEKKPEKEKIIAKSEEKKEEKATLEPKEEPKEEKNNQPAGEKAEAKEEPKELKTEVKVEAKEEKPQEVPAVAEIKHPAKEESKEEELM